MSKIVTCEECGIEYYSETIVPRMSFRHVYPDIVKLETELADARAEIERLKLVSQNQETVIAAQRRSAKAKNELIEQMREALELMLEGAMHDFHYVCQHRDNCLCWGCQKARIKAAIAAERGEG